MSVPAPRAGFTLVETALVLALAIFLFALIWFGVATANEQIRANAMERDAREAVRSIREYARSQAQLGTVAGVDLTDNIIDAGALPPTVRQVRTASPAEAYHPWDGRLYVYGWGQTFALRYDSLTAAACSKIVSVLSGDTSLGIRQADISNQTGPTLLVSYSVAAMPVALSTATTTCSSVSQTSVSIYFSIRDPNSSG